MRYDVTLVGTGRWPNHLARLLRDRSGLRVNVVAVDRPRSVHRLVLPSRAWVRIGLRPAAAPWRGRLFDVLWRLTLAVHGGAAACYWIGTDVVDAVREHQREGRVPPPWTSRMDHWAGAPWLADEVRSLGLQAEDLLFPTWPVDTATSKTEAWPDSFCVSAYIPAERACFYGWGELLALAAKFPDIPVLVFGEGSEGLEAPPNVELLGVVPVGAEVIRSSVLHVRLTRHDAVAGTVREALMAGRYAIFPYDLPGVLKVAHGDAEELIREVERLRSRFDRGELPPNDEGRRFALELCGEATADAFIRRITELSGAGVGR